MSDRKPVLLRIDPDVHDALARWAADEFRSLNADVEMLLRQALDDAGRMPKKAKPLPETGPPAHRLTRPPCGMHGIESPARSRRVSLPRGRRA